MINNQTTLPFNLSTYPPKKPDRQIGERVRQLSRLKHGRLRQEVEQEILERSKLGGETSPEPEQATTPGERNL